MTMETSKAPEVSAVPSYFSTKMAVENTPSRGSCPKQSLSIPLLSSTFSSLVTLMFASYVSALVPLGQVLGTVAFRSKQPGSSVPTDCYMHICISEQNPAQTKASRGSPDPDELAALE